MATKKDVKETVSIFYIKNKNNFPCNVKYGKNTIRLSPSQKEKINIDLIDKSKLPKKVMIIEIKK